MRVIEDVETLSALGPRQLFEDQLTAWGEKVGASVAPPLWIALYGPLGVGKSVLARSIARGADVAGHIPSPSFTLVHSYHSPRSFDINHVDLFRLRPGDSLEPLGWDDLLRSAGLVLVEWASRAGEQQPANRWEVFLDYGESPDSRKVRVERLGDSSVLIDR